MFSALGETVFGGASFTPLKALASATVELENIGASYNGNAEMTETTAAIGGAKGFDRVYGHDRKDRSPVMTQNRKTVPGKAGGDRLGVAVRRTARDATERTR